MFKIKSLSIQAMGRLLIVFLNTTFTFVNSFLFSDNQLISLVELVATIMILTTLFELGSSRMIMKYSLNEKKEQHQYQLHFTYLLSNSLFILAIFFVAITFLPMLREFYYVFLVIISLSLVFMFPERLLALKLRNDWWWVFYEFLISSTFTIFSLFLYMKFTISESLPYVAAFYALIAIYTNVKRSPKIHISFQHLKKDTKLVIETFVTSIFINGLAFWDLGLSEKTQYFTIRLLSAPRILASLYINYVFQNKQNNWLIGLVLILIILCLGISMQYFEFIGYYFLPYLLWICVFLYVVTIWVSNILNKEFIWWTNFVMIIIAQVFYYLINVSSLYVLLLIAFISGYSFIVLLRKY